jgi:phage/conjugal plasmid C-4 type zinc finger TraR family protein
MGDVIDRAGEYTEKGLSARIQEIRRAAAGDDGLIECEDCGEEIPAARRRAVPGCRCCVECQQDREAFRGK